MKRYLLLLAASLVPVCAQPVFIVDQRTPGEPGPLPFGEGHYLQLVPRPYGQTFTPTLSEVGFVLFNVADAIPNNGRGATLFVDLYTSPAGELRLGSTRPLALPDSFRGRATLLFDPPLALVPGVEYFLDPQVADYTEDPNGTELIPSDNWGIDQTEAFYPGGTEIIGGRRAVGLNIWFQEGTVVPEPSSWALGLAGGVLFGVLSLAKRWRERPGS